MWILCHFYEGSDKTKRLRFHFSLSCIGEGNGNPLQCSCLENPRDGGAWWAAVYGVALSRTRLKWLSSRASMDLSIVRESWNQPLVDVEGWLYVLWINTKEVVEEKEFPCNDGEVKLSEFGRWIKYLWRSIHTALFKEFKRRREVG